MSVTAYSKKKKEKRGGEDVAEGEEEKEGETGKREDGRREEGKLFLKFFKTF